LDSIFCCCVTGFKTNPHSKLETILVQSKVKFVRYNKSWLLLHCTSQRTKLVFTQKGHQLVKIWMILFVAVWLVSQPVPAVILKLALISLVHFRLGILCYIRFLINGSNWPTLFPFLEFKQKSWIPRDECPDKRHELHSKCLHYVHGPL
jgi:hypothetical protein